MADPSYALQVGVIAALRAASDVTDEVVNRIYDEPPQSPTRPFVRIGNIERQALRTDGQPTAHPITFSVEAHSRPNSGRVEAQRIAAAVIAALDEQEDTISLTGFDLIRLQFITTVTIKDSDGQSYQSNAVFEALLDT